ncbi:6-phosphogluconolactonase [Microcoleus sp. LEGE 07076]|uniref:6-phosphogluconolactonase n=1 Tax=Microcoleus sp. LEGE 07076 TaxID=915322 RepID=UPI00187F3414|nr:6-phosphogluconolactonase [Microcoleus sp. LEGE 07076]MBE9184306.1 6-phosphogluconolactonase [Microcoleus sp. LEGE 07076]
MKKVVEVLANREQLIERSLAIVLRQIAAAIAERGICTIALAGGSTPEPLYRSIASQDLPWDKIHVFWGDERYVPPEHQDSNQKMARLAWLDRVNTPASNIHPMPTGTGDPAADAIAHQTELQQFFKVSDGEFPAFDIILLGIGDDAHTASLFPGTPALQVRDALVTVGNKDGQPRITFTVPLINRARCVIFIVAGASKQPALAQIFAPAADPMTYPARLVQPEGELWWLLDAAAGEAVK